MRNNTGGEKMQNTYEGLNCEAGWSEAEAKRLKIAGERCFGEPAFMPFLGERRAVSTAPRLTGTSRSQWSSSQSFSQSNNSFLSSVKSLNFHDGQNYRIVMNYYYARTERTKVIDSESPLRWHWETTTYKDAVRDYSSLQTVNRPFSNGNLNWRVDSALTNGYPPIDKRYGQIINGGPDYWTSSGKVLCGNYYGHYGWVLNPEWPGELPHYFWEWVNDPAVLIGLTGTSSAGGNIFQDVYQTSGGALLPSHPYTLSFYAKGSGSGTRAVVEWWKAGASSPVKTSSQTITATSWPSSPLTLTSVSPPSTQPFDYARVTFIADSGKYLYVSSTSFG